MGKNQDLAKGIFANGVSGNVSGTATTATNVDGGTARISSIKGTDQQIENNYGAYLHIGGWGVGRTDASAVLVNTSYMADLLATARTINGVSFNGSANITVADSTKLPLSGGTLTGDLTGTTGSFSGNLSAPIFYDSNNTSYFADFSNTGTSINTAGDIVSNSDIRLKENITIIDDAINKIKKINGVTYNKIGETKRTAGVIAQDVEVVLPEVVSQQGDFKSVAYGNMVGLLIEAIKDQQKVIENLENRINLLEET